MREEHQYFGYSERQIGVYGLTRNDTIKFIFNDRMNNLTVEISINKEDKDIKGFISKFIKCVEYMELNYSDIAKTLVGDSLSQFNAEIIRENIKLQLYNSPIELMLDSMIRAINTEHSK